MELTINQELRDNLGQHSDVPQEENRCACGCGATAKSYGGFSSDACLGSYLLRVANKSGKNLVRSSAEASRKEEEESETDQGHDEEGIQES